MSEQLSQKDFADQLNTTFKIYFTPDEPAEAELIEATEPVTRGASEQFSLLFLVGPDQPIEQRLYAVEHTVLGKLDLFLVPIGKLETGIKYEAVFNRLTR